MSYPHSTSPSVEHADPFNLSTLPRRYIYSDNDSEHVDSYGPRDTYASDGSNNGLNDSDRYYDHNGTYDPYGEHTRFGTLSLTVYMTSSTTRYGFGPRRLWSWVCTVRRVAGPVADWTFRAGCHPIRRLCATIEYQGAVPRLDDGAPDTAVQGRN